MVIFHSYVSLPEGNDGHYNSNMMYYSGIMIVNFFFDVWYNIPWFMMYGIILWYYNGHMIIVIIDMILVVMEP